MIDFAKLAEPFDPKDLEWRAQREGKSNGKPWVMVVCYVDNRAIMNRLDAVVGPANWKNEYRPWEVGGKSGVLCGLSIRIDEEDMMGGWVTKWDGADPTDIEPIKGGLSDSMKRAAVQWGIGRYLYNLDSTFAKVVESRVEGARQGGKHPDTYWWLPPALPTWALPTPPAQKPTQKLIDAVKELIAEKKLTFSFTEFPTHAALLAEYNRLKALPDKAAA